MKLVVVEPKLALIVWFVCTLLNVYELVAPTELPSTVTLSTAYPEFAVIVNVLLLPEETITLPDGAIAPFAPALAVIV
jgi:hypothetical protein